MGYILNILHGTVSLDKLSIHDGPEWLQHKRCSYTGKLAKFRMRNGALLALQGYSIKISGELAGHAKSSINHRHEQPTPSVSNALQTIKYLHEAGAKVILVSDWDTDSELSRTESVADFLSEVLQIQIVPLQKISCNKLSKIEGTEKPDILLAENLSKFKEEVSNCLEFAKELSSGVDIFVNDSFSHSHKVLASTVGVTRFCYACMAGFHFEESLYQLKKVTDATKKPYVAIIGGSDFHNKAAALRFLTSRCQALVFVGMISFQIMHALGVSVPLDLVELKACNEALHIVQLARERNMQILCPKDFSCRNESNPKQLQVFPAHSILDGWVPVDLGPASLDEIGSLLGTSKKVIWMGPMRFVGSSKYTIGAANLAKMLDQISSNCEITVVGNMACQVVTQELSSLSVINLVENASVVWEFLKGRKLPGVMALDRAYPFEINWNDLYADPAQPLFVDIGSGNGLFLLEMARRRKDLNFLGLEINEKLVRRCLESVHQLGIGNGHFIATNATSTFRSILSSYPGELILVSIQCPNPDFNKPEHRWRMLQRSLIEAVTDLLSCGGKVFLQSDVEEVAMRMKEQFLRYGKGKLNLVHEQDHQCNGRSSWLTENPFGVRSDWERHVLDRGDPMYRLMFSKSNDTREAMGYNCQ
ncbi:uncharacterized protein LOC114732066 isoform X2 [Neltuma alba]|uniref:uncharacterized protein LOC114732066 isoform X2 n=1 Tax=Neltuma alba TaxID=207710 RepID=UPI0010A477A1|nr:uncharacterized protein LOC114732066 isoform X2 [Prosopis alba]